MSAVAGHVFITNHKTALKHIVVIATFWARKIHKATEIQTNARNALQYILLSGRNRKIPVVLAILQIVIINNVSLVTEPFLIIIAKENI